MNLSHRVMVTMGAALFAFAALAANPASAAGSSPSPLWPQNASDIPTDPAVTYGVLENGLRYAVMRNTEPPGRVSLRLYVNSGSLMETEDQRGLAHFTEHMAFNGTKHHAVGDMVEYFQRLGMGFGNDTNAHTSWDETVYKMELPSASDVMMDDGMQMLRDYADGLLFTPAEIDKERGVILAEKRDRDSVRYRIFVDSLQFSLPDSLIPRRLPIGEESVISTAKQDRFLSYYNKWYTTDRMVVLVVGDIDPARAATFVKKFFMDMPAPALRLKSPDLGKIKPRGVVTKVLREPEAPAVEVDISNIREMKFAGDTVAERTHRIALDVANSILVRRLQILAKTDGAPFTEGAAYNFHWLNFVNSSEIDITCPPDKWRDAMGVAEQELRRALQYGFTKAELSEAVANARNAYEEAVKRARTRKSYDLADGMSNCLGEAQVFSSPESDLDIAAKVLDSLTTDKVLGEFRDSWAGDTRIVYVSGNLPEGTTDLQVRDAYGTSARKPVEAPKVVESAAFAYQDFGKAAKAESAHDIIDLDITQVKFSNNVYLNLRPSDYEKNVVRIYVRFGGGLLEAPKNMQGLPAFSEMVFTAGGLKKHSADDIAPIFAGRNVSVSFGVEPDSFVIEGKTTPRDLQDELNLMAAYMVEPGYREEAVRLAKKTIPQTYMELRHTPDGVMQDQVASFLASGDFRFGFPPEEVLESRTMAEVQNWLSVPLSRERLEISIAGDINPDTTIPMVARTFGALPKRDVSKPEFADERKLTLPQSQVRTFEYDSQLKKATLLFIWPTDDQWNVGRARRLMVLADIISDRMRVELREKLGEAYSPYAFNMPSDTFTHYGYLSCIVELSPDKVEQASALLRMVGADIAKNGVKQDEFDRAVKPMLEEVAQMRRSNNYWIRKVLSSSQEYPVRLEWARNMTDDLKSITIADVNALAKQYLLPESIVDIRVQPVASHADAAPKPAVDGKPAK